jgi:hypothetical protein
MLTAFTRHPRSVGETYLQHMAFAWRSGFVLVGAGAACLVHGLLPFAFVTKGGDMVRRMNDRMQRRRGAASEDDATARAPSRLSA